MPRKSKEPAVSEDTNQAAEAEPTAADIAPSLDMAAQVEIAKAEAEAILETARREAAAIRQGALEEARAASERVARVETVVNEPDPAPEGANIVPEPVVNEAGGKEVPTFFPGIRRFDF